jgi:hypothetical protein
MQNICEEISWLSTFGRRRIWDDKDDGSWSSISGADILGSAISLQFFPMAAHVELCPPLY